MSTRLGPKLTMSVSCFGCIYEVSERYAVQGDSGCKVLCKHPSNEAPKSVGDTNWDTPKWCPEMNNAAAQVAELAANLFERGERGEHRR